ncbi:MAG: DUF4834 family protein [Duncaniella sp.]|nr:DUF4834 family protein [Duncaniella sp.]
MGFLLFLIIFFIVVRLAWPWISRKLQEKAARMMAERMQRDFERQQRQHQGDPFFSMFSSFFNQGQASRRQSPDPSAPVRRKVFTRDVGEYVEYEDLEGNYHYQSTETRTVVEESQISDAEWEEIR